MINSSPVLEHAGRAARDCLILCILDPQSIIAAADVNPAPNAKNSIFEFCLILFCSKASVRATGIDAAEVFPYLSRLMKTFSNGRSHLLAVAWSILVFACVEYRVQYPPLLNLLLPELLWRV